MELKQCECGCGNAIEAFDKKGRPRRFCKGHRDYSKWIKSFNDRQKRSTRICTKCKKDLSSECFRVRIDTRSKEVRARLSSSCKECEKEYNNSAKVRARRNEWKKQKRKNEEHTIESWIAKRFNSWKSKTPNCDLDCKYLVDLYHSQNGNCYYTNEKMVFPKGTNYTKGISLDRLRPDKGYIKGNVVFCHYDINTMKGARTEEEFYSRMIDILKNKSKISKNEPK